MAARQLFPLSEKSSPPTSTTEKVKCIMILFMILFSWLLKAASGFWTTLRACIPNKKNFYRVPCLTVNCGANTSHTNQSIYIWLQPSVCTRSTHHTHPAVHSTTERCCWFCTLFRTTGSQAVSRSNHCRIRTATRGLPQFFRFPPQPKLFLLPLTGACRRAYKIFLPHCLSDTQKWIDLVSQQ